MLWTGGSPPAGSFITPLQKETYMPPLIALIALLVATVAKIVFDETKA